MPPSKQSAEQRVRAYAAKLWEVIGIALPKLDTSTRGVLGTRVSDSDIRWGLSLVLAIWRLSKEGPDRAAVEGILISAGGQLILTELAKLEGALPDTFKVFLEGTLSATDSYKFAGSAVYFRAAVDELGALKLAALHRWLRSAPFYETTRQLILRFPEPGSQRPPLSAITGALEGTRGDRFDRADFARPTQRRSATTPTLSGEDVARVTLANKGWDAKSIDSQMNGPKKG